MTLDEAFEKYPDTTILRRKGNWFCASIKWWKMHKAWATPEARRDGFIIPDKMIEDANANDFEVTTDE